MSTFILPSGRKTKANNKIYYHINTSELPLMPSNMQYLVDLKGLQQASFNSATLTWYFKTLLAGVKQACSEFLEKQLDPSNCLGICSFAENHSCEILRQAAELYTFKYFDDVIRHEEFQSLSLKDIENLVKSDEIQVLF